MIKFMILLQSISLLFSGLFTTQQSYNYTYWGEIASAESMHLLRAIDNSNITDINDVRNPVVLGDLRDAFVYKEFIYVSDATANKVFVFNNEFKYVKSFPQDGDEQGKLNTPNGVYVFNDLLYVADYNNNRIAIFDINTNELVNEVKNPNDVIFETVDFKPLRVAVDRTGRINVVAYNIFEGVMEFDTDGQFNRFFGTNTIKFNFFEALIYKFATKEQREKMSLNLQSSFISLDIDKEGYIYTASKTEYWEPVKRLNFKGKNVLENKGLVPVIGDSVTQEQDSRVEVGPSQIIDVAVHESMQRYSILDQNRGRIFTYDKEGNLLYISGGKGTLQDQLSSPTSITYFNEYIIVTDSTSKSIKIYEPVQFAKLVNKAISEYTAMDYVAARDTWAEVLKLNSNYFLAYAGIGRAQLREGNYEDAMKNFELGYDYYNYSKAFEQYRNNQLAAFLPYVLVVGLGAIGFVIFKSIKQAVKREGED